MPFTEKESYDIEDLVSIMELLRSPGGCPWDREQTHESIRRNFIEETYEAVEAIDRGDTDLLREELGDVLLQVVFHARMEEEKGAFSFRDVCDGICKKLILRHPHIFAGEKADSPDEVLRNWDAIKKKEKNQKTHTQSLKSVSGALPALIRSEKVQNRAADAGFDYEDAAGAFSDLVSEVDELREAMATGDRDGISGELGDLLFAAVNVARFVQVDAEESLRVSCEKFITRFEQVEKLATEKNIDMAGSDMKLLDSLWQEAKHNLER